MRRSSTPVSYRPRLEVLEERALPSADFQILDLAAVDFFPNVFHQEITGDQRGGIAASSSHLFYTGEERTGMFEIADIRNGTPLGVRYDGLVSDLHTQTVYVLGIDASTPLISESIIADGSATITHLLEIDGVTGALTGTSIDLSVSIVVTASEGNQPDLGIFAGYDRILLHLHNSNIWSIDVATGMVTDLGVLDSPTHIGCESLGYWGVAERFEGEDYLIFIEDRQNIARRRVSDGEITHRFLFEDLGNACSFTVSLSQQHWYFQSDDVSQFGGTVVQDGILVDPSAEFSITINDPPVITLSGSNGTESDADHQQFSWSVIDPNGNLEAVAVTISKDGQILQTLTTSQGDFDFNAEGLGSFTIELSASDADGETVLDTRNVVVSDDDADAPEIVFMNAVDQYDTDDNFVSWAISDVLSGISSRSVRLFAVGDDTPIFVNVLDDEGSFDLNGLPVGEYRIEIEAADGDEDRLLDAATGVASRTFSIVHLPMAGSVQFGSAAYLGPESIGEVQVIIERQGGDGGSFSVRLTSNAVTAQSGVDYAVVDRLVEFGENENQQSVTISIFNDPRVCEKSETFQLILSEPTRGAVIGEPLRTTIVIEESQSFATLDQCFIGQAYQDLLHRPVEPEGLDYWSRRLGLTNRSEVALGIQQSPEYQAIVVQQLFGQYLNREADADELSAYVDVMGNSGTIPQVAQSLIGLPEYYDGVSDGTDEGFIRTFYLDALGEIISDEALASHLSQPPLVREQVADDVFQSTDFLSQLINGYYFDFLHRAGETGGIAFYLRRLRNGERYEHIIASFLGSPEYYLNLQNG